jgi:hypothetical protein
VWQSVQQAVDHILDKMSLQDIMKNEELKQDSEIIYQAASEI